MAGTTRARTVGCIAAGLLSTVLAWDSGTAAAETAPPGTLTLTSAVVRAVGEDGYSTTPAISGDGRYVAFYSEASNLVAGDTNATSDVFVRDLVAGTVERVSVADDESQAPRGGWSDPAISDDGRYVAFMAPDGLAPGVPSAENGWSRVYVRDRMAQTTELASRATDGTSALGVNPVLSADGRFVGFTSPSPGLVAGDDVYGSENLFVRDRTTGATTMVDVDTGGGLPDISGGYWRAPTARW